jgi:hypothetical protein
VAAAAGGHEMRPCGRCVRLGGGGFGGEPPSRAACGGTEKRGESGRAGSGGRRLEKMLRYSPALAHLQEVGERDEAVLWQGDAGVVCRQVRGAK